MIVLFDLQIGNLSSVRSGFARAGAETLIVQTEAEWTRVAATGTVSGIVLPGVGAFGDAMFQMRASGLLKAVRTAIKSGIPVLGICLGMQLLFSVSEEHGSHVGLGVLPGRVIRFPSSVKVPHMGWNDLATVAQHPLLDGVAKGDYVYFVHSYRAILDDERSLLAAADYEGILVPAVVGRDKVYGTQFHPEKSGRVGEMILHNFTQICAQYRASTDENQTPGASRGTFA